MVVVISMLSNMSWLRWLILLSCILFLAIKNLLKVLFFWKWCLRKLWNCNFVVFVLLDNHFELERIGLRNLLLRLRWYMKQLNFLRLTLSFLEIWGCNLVSFDHIHFFRLLFIFLSLLLFLFLFMLFFLVSPLTALYINFFDFQMSNQINNRENVLLAEGLLVEQF